MTLSVLHGDEAQTMLHGSDGLDGVVNGMLIPFQPPSTSSYSFCLVTSVKGRTIAW